MDRRALHRRLLTLVGIVSLARPTAAHVDYVTDPAGDTVDAVAFVREVLSDPLNAALVGGSTVAVIVCLALYLRFRPRVKDIEILRETLSSYADLIPWMLRLSLGLPLVGAGFQGYLFAPTVTFDPTANPLLRVLFIGLGFFLLFGLGTRIVVSVGTVLYLYSLTVSSDVLLALEYLPGFLALFLLGGGRPSADEILLNIASTDGTLYGRIDPIHVLKRRLDELTRPYRQYVSTVLRFGLGVSFVFLGITQKLGDPARSLAAVDKYNLTAIVPVDPGLWVVGVGLTEAAVGIALIVGLLTRASAGTAFLLFTITLFGLPDDPVLAHVTLFGMASALFTLGSGPLSLDRYLTPGQSTEVDVTPVAD